MRLRDGDLAQRLIAVLLSLDRKKRHLQEICDSTQRDAFVEQLLDGPQAVLSETRAWMKPCLDRPGLARTPS